MKLLVSWIGGADLKAVTSSEAEIGPIARIVRAQAFDRIVLLNDRPPARETEVEAFERWLKPQATATIGIKKVEFRSPMDFGSIYGTAASVLDAVKSENEAVEFTFNISSGTPAMTVAFLLLGKARYDGELVEAWTGGVKVADFPFTFPTELIADFVEQRDARLRAVAEDELPEEGKFQDILYKTATMRDLVDAAKRAAASGLPVLIQGETGSGKELLARAIHGTAASWNKKFDSGKFVLRNCGLVPDEAFAREFHGFLRSAVPGATGDRQGVYEEAGTLFLDEIDKLPSGAQFILQQALRDREYQKLGEPSKRTLKARIIAGTTSNLMSEVADGRFRDDLFYRLNIHVLKIPPLRERKSDIPGLAAHFLDDIADKLKSQPKRLSAGARDRLMRHDWPGNVRELRYTLLRAVAATDAESLTAADIEAALFQNPSHEAGLLDRPLGHGFRLKDLVHEVEDHYVRRALQESRDNKSLAARLLGLNSHQNLRDLMTRLGMAAPTS